MQAINALVCAVHADGRQPQVWRKLGMLYRETGDAERSLDALLRCVRLDATDAASMLDAAALLREAGKPHRALTLYRQALRCPTVPSPLAVMQTAAGVAHAAGDVPAAIAFLADALAYCTGGAGGGGSSGGGVLAPHYDAAGDAQRVAHMLGALLLQRGEWAAAAQVVSRLTAYLAAGVGAGQLRGADSAVRLEVVAQGAVAALRLNDDAGAAAALTRLRDGVRVPGDLVLALADVMDVVETLLATGRAGVAGELLDQLRGGGPSVVAALAAPPLDSRTDLARADCLMAAGRPDAAAPLYATHVDNLGAAVPRRADRALEALLAVNNMAAVASLLEDDNLAHAGTAGAEAADTDVASKRALSCFRAALLAADTAGCVFVLCVLWLAAGTR